MEANKGKKRILIVDDQEINRGILHQILQNKYEIEEAFNGAEAMEKLHLLSTVDLVITDIVMPVLDGYGLLHQMRADSRTKEIPVIVATSREDDTSVIGAFEAGADDVFAKPYNAKLLHVRIQNLLERQENNLLRAELERQEEIIKITRYDSLTGLCNRSTFLEKAAKMITEHEPGYYMLVSFDVEGFKSINTQYGTEMGDLVLNHIADCGRKMLPEGVLLSRFFADDFAMMYPAALLDQDFLVKIREQIQRGSDDVVSFLISVGRYLVEDRSLPVAAMYDRAVMALSAVKGSYGTRIARYDKTMYGKFQREQQIVGAMQQALEDDEFQIYLQPQYDVMENKLSGAEALVRWIRPGIGVVSPGEFISIFEKNGFIYEMDKYVWEKTARLQRRWLDEGRTLLPISINVSRVDVLKADFIETVDSIVKRYRLPEDALRFEITESAFARDTKAIVHTVRRLQELGFLVEIDDFGSGYSSFNTLKDIPADIMKMDMKFLESNEDTERSAVIMESIIRMSRWLGMRVIAEGVETRNQTEFLKSIGCHYVQGYFFGRPMPIEQYESLFDSTEKLSDVNLLQVVEGVDSNSLWNPDAVESMVFTNYTSGALLAECREGQFEVIRMNDQLPGVLRTRQTVDELLNRKVKDAISGTGMEQLMELADRSFDTESRMDGECCIRIIHDSPAHEEYVRYFLRTIAKADSRSVVYITLENISAQKKAEKEVQEARKRMEDTISNIPAGIGVYDIREHQLYPRYMSGSLMALYGFSREEYESRMKAELPAFNSEAGKILCELAEQAQPQNMTELTVMVSKKGGEKIPVQVLMHYVSAEPYPILYTVQRDITEQNAQLEFLNSMAREMISMEEPERDIRAVLERIREYFDGSRAYVLEADWERGVIYSTYEVCTDGAESATKHIKGISDRDFFWWINQFADQDVLVIRDVEAMGDEREAGKRLLLDQNIKSLFVVALLKNDKMEGALVVNNPGRNISQVQYMGALGDYMSVMLARRDIMAKSKGDKLRQREEELRFTMAQMGKIIARYDIENRTLMMPAEYAGKYGIKEVTLNMPESVISENEYFAGEDEQKVFCEFFEKIQSGARRGENLVHFVTKKGKTVWKHFEFVSIFDSNGRPQRAIISIEDVTEQVFTKQRAELDVMTGVYNRATAEELINARIELEDGKGCVFLLFDLDDLKVINDTLGHIQGDKALEKTAQVIRSHFRADDIVGRLGGDEFVAFLRGVSQEAAIKRSVEQVTRKLAELKVGVRGDFPICCSAGCVFGDSKDDSFAALYEKADIALYYVKRNGKNGYAFYEEGMQEK